MKITFVRNGAAAVPLSEEFSKIKDNATFTADVRIVRCPGLHRKFFKMVRIILANIPEKFGTQTVDSLREELLFRAGYFSKHILSTGQEVYKVQSISYESLDNVAFQELYNRVLDEGCKMLGAKISDMEEEINALS